MRRLSLLVLSAVLAMALCGAAATLSCLSGVKDFLSTLPNPPIVNGTLAALQKLPAKGPGGPLGNLFDNIHVSTLAANAMLQNLRLPVYTGAEIANYTSGVPSLDTACANMARNTVPGDNYVLGVASWGLDLPGLPVGSDSGKEQSWLSLNRMSVCGAVNPCANTYILGFDGFTTPPIDTPIGQFEFSLLRAGFSYGANFDSTSLQMVIHKGWAFDWNNPVPGTLSDVVRPVNVMLGGRVSWGLDVATGGGATVASVKIDADADVGLSTVSANREVIYSSNTKGPKLTLANLITLDLSGLLDLGQNVQWRFNGPNDFLFQYVMYRSATNDISRVLQSAPGLASILQPLLSFQGTSSLAVRADNIGVALRIEVDGSFSLAADISKLLKIPAVGAKATILLTKRHTDATFNTKICINDQCFCIGVYSRGIGRGIDQCPSGTVRDPSGLLCYPACRAGFDMVGPVCWSRCPSNFRDTGAHCLKPASYGRGAGFAWQFGDGLNLDGAMARCQAQNRQGCEQFGLVIYPKCAGGFRPEGCCVCTPNCPAGMRDIGVSCEKATYGNGAGFPLQCKAGEDQQGALCYPKCQAGFTGVGPLCWRFTC
ncbi:hypothetical protein HYH03_009343 [Edaphochlamys debaryana]|uniref:Uncharacterized protein n=1 Tax=Edaphochlamys debaryana TaxID=47281 RepID=A0A835XZC8_9CHLO|nr:hypothetical protein HYH03_009343 [Edaphochlamys debaryana]|eukprot:KAG2492397.1 hypothetical protein HYH03_009343 [Edaphochlamys debaryana]